MPAIAHAVLGEVTVDPGSGVFWERKLKLADRDISIDLTIGDVADATPKLFDWSAQFVTRLAEFEALARIGLRQSYDQDSDSAVALYMAHHLEELGAETLTRMFGTAKNSVGIDAFLAATFLRRVGLYPAASGGYATFDYTIGMDETDYLLAVRFNEEGKVVGIEMES